RPAHPARAHRALDLALVADERRARPQVGRERDVDEGVHATLAGDVDETELTLAVDLVEGEAAILGAHGRRGRDDRVDVLTGVVERCAVAEIADSDLDAEVAELDLAWRALAHEGADVALALAKAATDLKTEQAGSADDGDHGNTLRLRSGLAGARREHQPHPAQDHRSGDDKPPAHRLSQHRHRAK